MRVAICNFQDTIFNFVFESFLKKVCSLLFSPFWHEFQDFFGIQSKFEAL